MTDYVYCVVSSVRSRFLPCDAMRCAPIFLKSVAEHTDAAVIVSALITGVEQNELTAAHGGDIQFIPLLASDATELMMAKWRVLAGFDRLEEGDRIFVMDADTVVKGDIFAVFDEYPDMDVGLTARHYAHHEPYNAGVWCCRWGNATKEFMRLVIEQMERGTTRYDGSHNSDQMALHRVLYDDTFVPRWNVNIDPVTPVGVSWSPNGCAAKVVNIGHQYNFCPGIDRFSPADIKAAFCGAIDDPAIKVLHFKGDGSKDVMYAYAEDRYGRT